MSCNENSCTIYDNWCFKIGLLWFFSFNYVLWSYILGWFNRRKEAIHHPKESYYKCTGKRIEWIIIKSGSVHHELASEYIQSLLSPRRICRNLYKPHTYTAVILEANKTCMYQILTQLVSQKVYTIHKSSSLMLFH